MWGKGIVFEQYVAVDGSMRDFPPYDQVLENSILYFTDLALACECEVLGLEDADRTLTELIEKKAKYVQECRVSDGSFIGFKDEPVNVEASLKRVESAIREILDYERDLERTKDLNESRGDIDKRDAERKRRDEDFLTSHHEDIQYRLANHVRPVVEQVAKSWLPDASLYAAAYFMARAVLWRTSPEFMHKHHASLLEQSKALAQPSDEQDTEYSYLSRRPNIFLDADPFRGWTPKYGYRTPSVKFTRISSGLDPWPEPTPAPKTAEVVPIRPQPTPAPTSSSPIAKLSAAMRSLKDAALGLRNR